MRQAVVLCGGRAERLSSELQGEPKVLVSVGGRPLLEHLLLALHTHAFDDVVLLAGHLGRRVGEAAEQMAPSGMRVRTLIEPEPLGTAGALAGALDELAERFLLVLGDIFFDIDLSRMWEQACANGGLGTLLAHLSSHPEDSDLLSLGDDMSVLGWASAGGGGGRGAFHPPLTNAGVAVFSRKLLDYIPPGRASDLNREVVPARVADRAALYGYVSSEYARDLGTPARLERVRADASRGLPRLRAEAVLLDRDGVLVPERGPGAEVSELLPGVGAAVRRLNEAGIATALVTNQACRARGLCSEEELAAAHERIAALLEAEGARIDVWLHCPHHPETHHAEGIPALRGPCHCRKPGTGMVEEALRRLDAKPWRAVLVGDGTIDLQTAANSGIPGIGLRTGHGVRDGRYPARPTWVFDDLGAVARWIAPR